MFSHMRRNAVAYLALFVALGGTSYAAAQLPKNSVGTKQIKKNGVRSSDIKKSSVTTSKVKNGTLRASDFKAGTLLKGDKGDKGEPGTNGVNGAANVTYRRSLAAATGPGTFGETTASCEAGERLIGGGGGWVNAAGTEYILNSTIANSGPGTGSDTAIQEGQTPTNWHVAGENTAGVGNLRMSAYAVCAKP